MKNKEVESILLVNKYLLLNKNVNKPLVQNYLTQKVNKVLNSRKSETNSKSSFSIMDIFSI